MGRKIVFADDDFLIRKLYQRHLEKAGYEIVEATNGREAVEAARRENPELAVLDIVMPEEDGLSALLELKRSPATRNLPVILISAESKYYPHRRELLEAGAADFLTKPFGPAQLLAAIEQCLA